MPPSAPIRIAMREYQLVLLRRMADYQPELVERAREELGASVTEMREVNAHYQRMIRSRTYRGGLTTLQGFLGEPESQRRQRFGDLVSTSTQWRLPLWPDLFYEVLSAPNGPVFNEMFVRDPAVPAPQLQRLSDLKPWSCVISDVEKAFAPVKHREGSAPSRWTTMLTAPGDDGVPIEATAEFVWGLLQAVTVTN